MNVVRAAYLDRIAELYPPAEALLVVRSVDKLFDIELAIMLRDYQLESEEQLVARERAIQSDRLIALQTMSAGLAHEVSNPLNAAKLQLDLLECRLRAQLDDAKLIEPVELARHEIARLTHLLDEFLAFARPPQLAPEDTDVVADRAPRRRARALVCRSARRVARACSFAIERRSRRSIAARSTRSCRTSCATPSRPSGKSGRVTVAVAIEGPALHVRVGDNGPGIPDAIRTRIYEPFFSTKDSGTGMGMSIVHNFVAMHGGKIDITTGPRGTLVDVAIPDAMIGSARDVSRERPEPGKIATSMSREVVRASAWAIAFTLALAVLIVLGSRNLAHFDAALVGYTFATLFATFGITYRYAMWLQRPPTRMYWRRGWRAFLSPRQLPGNLARGREARRRRGRRESLHLPARIACAG